MKSINFTLLAAAATMGLSPVSAQIVATRIAQTGPMLPANTLVYVSLNDNLTSQSTAEGDTFDVTVTRPVIVGDYIVIPQGTLGHGRITWRTGKAVFGKSAKMTFELTDLQIGNQTVPMSGHYRLEGKGNTGWTVGSIAAFGIMAGFFVTGHSAAAFQGTEYKAFTKAPTSFALADPGSSAYYAAGGNLPVNLGRNNGGAPFANGRQLAQAQMLSTQGYGGNAVSSPY
jgi:hypothetical protein